MYSIYHFWKHLVENKSLFAGTIDLDHFDFDREMLSCENKARFPDLAIKLNQKRDTFTGGELIELKDSKRYSISSFNSTVPTGKKSIRKLIPFPRGKIYSQMTAAGDDVFSLEERETYYLIRGHNKEYQKICLVHGSFFETINIKELISKSFSQVLEETLINTDIAQNVKEVLETLFSEQANFSKVRNVDGASVTLRFRVMTEVKRAGNILNSKMYPDIMDDTLNLVVPYHSEEERLEVVSRLGLVFEKQLIDQIRVLSIKHPFNGWFVVFQVNL
jgi:hypothetical protein